MLPYVCKAYSVGQIIIDSRYIVVPLLPALFAYVAVYYKLLTLAALYSRQA